MTRQLGFSMIEVLVTIVILAFGLLGLAGLQARSMNLEMESYQRSQALVILHDMTSRLESAAATSGLSYVTTSPLGTGDTQPVDCSSQVPGAALDHCIWSNMLKGAAETSSGSNVGAMIGARACITEIQAPDPTNGTCQPGVYEVAVAWQGMMNTVAPSISCGQDLYGNDAARRVIALRIVTATTACQL